VARISQKRDAANGPVLHRHAVEERPYEGLIDGREDFAHLWVPAFERGEGLGHITVIRP